MCTNYVAPGDAPGLSELRIDNFRDLYRWTPWQPEIYQGYDAPIVANIERRFTPLIAGFGFWPRSLQKANVEKAKEQWRKPLIMRGTMNVRDNNLGKSPLYGPTWRSGGRCLMKRANGQSAAFRQLSHFQPHGVLRSVRTLESRTLRYVRVKRKIADRRAGRARAPCA